MKRNKGVISSLRRKPTTHHFTFHELIWDGLKLTPECNEASHLQYLANKLGFERIRTESKTSFVKSYPFLYYKGRQRIPVLFFKIYVELYYEPSTSAMETRVGTAVVDNTDTYYSPYYNRSKGQKNLNVEKADYHINKICNSLVKAGLLAV